MPKPLDARQPYNDLPNVDIVRIQASHINEPPPAQRVN